MQLSQKQKDTVEINKAFDEMSKAIKKFIRLCEDKKSPVRRITYMSYDSGEVLSKITVSYKKKKKG